MLNQIHIRDLATIEDQLLHLNHGSNMITGETGAGKSIFIEAIELALGARGSPNLIRTGKDRADISLCFDVTHSTKVIEWLDANDHTHDGGECIIRRVISSDGRSRCYINGLPTTLQLVRELGELLFHLHGQYEQQVLLKIENQREILDRYAEHMPLANQVRGLASQWSALSQKIAALRESAEDRNERANYLRFQLDELDDLQLKPGEWETLETEHHKLTHAEELLQNLQRALQLLADDEVQNVQTKLHDMRKLLESSQTVEPSAASWLNTLNSSLIQLDDLEAELRNYLEATQLDPERLQLTEQRIGQVFTLARKNKVQPQELCVLRERFAAELKLADTSDSQVAELELELASIAKNYETLAAKLSHSRANAAPKFAKVITATIRSLSLPHGEFSVQFDKESTPYSAHGLEKITFLIKTNPDQTQQPLAKVISGGELSRLSLAVHLALAGQTNTPTLVFDEVDTGVGGATAEKIGQLLRQLGDTYQVFCVTHQPQVAASGHHHLLVEKYFVDKSTHTRLRFLNQSERTDEIARMLGGAKITEKTLAHAREVLSTY